MFLWVALAGSLGLFLAMLIGLIVFKTKKLPSEILFTFYAAIWLVIYLRLRSGGRSFAEIKLTNYPLRNFSTGFLIGGCFMSAAFALLVALQAVGFSRFAINPSLAAALLSGLLYTIIQASAEEALFRGYFLNILAWKSRLTAILATSALFSLVHFWHGINLTGWLNIFLFGVFAAQTTYVFHSLWIPIGFHTGWNYFQHYIFTFPSYGSGTFNGLLALHDADRGMLSGGSYGPEGSVIITLLLVLAVVLMQRQQGHVVPGQAAVKTGPGKSMTAETMAGGRTDE